MKQYSFGGLAGCVQQTRNRQTGTLISVFRDEQAGLDPDGGGWSTVCEEHSHVITHETLALARSFAAVPLEWCEGCMEEQS